MLTTTKETGYFGENIAARYLEQRGYTILERNYRKIFGEIDLIVQKESVIHFIEVKTNKNYGRGDGFSPELRVNPKKISHISKVALAYLNNHGQLIDTEWQIDIVSVIIDESRRKASITHFKNVAAAIY